MIGFFSTNEYLFQAFRIDDQNELNVTKQSVVFTFMN